jgi:hypothetical protein
MCPKTGTAARERERVLDLKKLSPGEMTTFVSGVLLLVFSFFPWYGHDFGSVTVNRSGWGAPNGFLSVIAILLAIVLVGLIVVDKFTSVELPERLGNFGWGAVHLVGGGIVFVLVLLKALFGGDYLGLGLDRKLGLWLGLVAAIGMAVGGYLIAKEAGQLPGALGGAKGGSATPPPPTA